MAQQIPLTKGLVALVDDEDSDLANYKWHTVGGYAIRYLYTPKRIRVPMHRIVLERKMGRKLQPDEATDHIDRNRANNTRNNLRVVTHTQNMRNKTKCDGTSSQYLGVSLQKKAGKWTAYIRLNGRLKHLGLFNKELDAAIAYDLAAHWYFGEYASLNIGTKY